VRIAACPYNTDVRCTLAFSELRLDSADHL
jgi:hypothetical protein